VQLTVAEQAVGLGVVREGQSGLQLQPEILVDLVSVAEAGIEAGVERQLVLGVEAAHEEAHLVLIRRSGRAGGTDVVDPEFLAADGVDATREALSCSRLWPGGSQQHESGKQDPGTRDPWGHGSVLLVGKRGSEFRWLDNNTFDRDLSCTIMDDRPLFDPGEINPTARRLT
jgi:hypothetical protein